MLDQKLLTQAVGELDEEKVQSMLSAFVAANPTSEEAQEVVAACQAGMGVVGELFESGEYFVGDLIFAGEVLSNAIKLLKPVLGDVESSTIGTMVLGTVAGDLHDIGKNIFKNMSEAAGFVVHDIGIDQPPAVFVEKVKEVKPQIVGMSGLLTLALESMKETVDALQEAGLRDGVKIIIGGNATTKEAAEKIGVEAHSNNAAEAVKVIQSWV